ncbi:MAG TPA: hypothetical protein VL173_11490 [Vicinamibacterales bacterium]|nr:hypothetical protein [Vicinamibacterales bacterium]
MSLIQYSVNVVRRTLRHASKNTNRVRRHAYHRARYTSAGRAALAVSDFLTSPRDALQRRSVVSQYNREHPNTGMTRDGGYAMVTPSMLPGVHAIIPLAVRLFEAKQRQLETGPAHELHAKKWAFMRSVLTNSDLRANPALVDFALSDALLSLVTNYLGTIPHLNRVDLLYSIAHGGEEAISSQIYHLDPEGRRQAKLFLNLRDVGPDEGPFTFIPAPETSRIVNAIKQRRRGDADMAMARYLDNELEAVNGFAKAVAAEGPAGSGVLVDTSRCLHFGSRVKPGTYRLCLYIQYCSSREHGNLFDMARYERDPIRLLATVNSRRAATSGVFAPHQMG